MKITVWSVLSGKVSGHLVINIPATHTIRKVLSTYCNYKGVSQSDGYVIRSRDNLVLNPNKTLKQTGVQEGDTLTLGLIEDEHQAFAYGSWWIVMLASFIIGIIGLIIACWIFLQPVQPPLKFGIVIDAGSSHSEVFLFTWNGEKPLGTADVELYHQCLIVGGITSFATHIDDLGKYFGHCISEVSAQIPSKLHARTPLYVGATAGMRILSKFDPKGADGILMSVREFLGRNTTFQVDPNNVGILSGFQEGASGWIAVNYLLNKFKQPRTKTAFTLDVGGASVQVTSELPSGGHWQSSNVTLFNHPYQISSQSFLCYGVHEASHRYHYLLVNESNTDMLETSTATPAATVDPCLAEGVTRELPVSEITGPCTLTRASTEPDLTGIITVNIAKLRKIFQSFMKVNDDHVPTALNTPKEDADFVVIEGSSDLVKCEQRVRQLFNYETCNSTFIYGDCMHAGLMPAINRTVVAFSRLFRHLNPLLHFGSEPSFAQFKDVVFNVCSLKADELFATYPGLDKDLAEDLCFDSMYVYSLLTAGLGISNATWPAIQFTAEVNNSEVVWPLGFMVNATSSFPSEPPPKLPLSIGTFTLLCLLFLAFILSGALFLYHSLKIHNHSVSYQRVIAEHIDKELQRLA